MKLKALFFLCSIFISASVNAGYPVEVNTASAEEIAESLDGIGLKKAMAIIEYREQFGAFQTPEDLVKVKGIGERTLQKNKEYLILGHGDEENMTSHD